MPEFGDGPMSWGCDIEIDHEDGYKTVIEVVDGHTYNLTPMWRLAGTCEVTRDFDGQNAGRLAPILTAGLIDALRHRDAYEALNPENGWGDYEGFIEILTRFVQLAWAHPTGTVRWNG
jgi:hypothetical protein